MSEHILDALGPQVTERVLTRRDAVLDLGRFGRGLAMASIPLGVAAMAKKAFAQGLPQEIVDVLNFALTLEYLEAEFYTMGVANASLFPSSQVRQTFAIIRDHEQEHVDFLRSTLGAQAVDKPTFDFTAGGAFDPFNDYPTFATLAQAFEDTGVRAYKGQAPNLMANDAVLTAALTIHSVEARHASRVRRLAASPAMQGWIPFAQPGAPAAIAAVYAGEAVTTQGGVDVVAAVQAMGVTEEDVTEAFDEPLTKQQVLEIVDAFIVGDVDGDGMEA